MWNLCRLILWALVDLFRPRAKLEAEILVLRQQINVLHSWGARESLDLSLPAGTSKGTPNQFR
jgi:hypothetical protein